MPRSAKANRLLLHRDVGSERVVVRKQARHIDELRICYWLTWFASHQTSLRASIRRASLFRRIPTPLPEWTEFETAGVFREAEHPTKT